MTRKTRYALWNGPVVSPDVIGCAPTRFVLWFRHQRRGKWQHVATAPSHAEIVNRVNGPGDWWVQPLYETRREPTGLFDDDDAKRCGTNDLPTAD